MERSRQKTSPAEANPVAISVTAEPSTEALLERIARRAYQRFEERGRQHGRDLDDWLEAERELKTNAG